MWQANVVNEGGGRSGSERAAWSPRGPTFLLGDLRRQRDNVDHHPLLTVEQHAIIRSQISISWRELSSCGKALPVSLYLHKPVDLQLHDISADLTGHQVGSRSNCGHSWQTKWQHQRHS